MGKKSQSWIIFTLAIQYHIQDHVYLSLCAGKKNQIWGNLLTVN